MVSNVIEPCKGGPRVGLLGRLRVRYESVRHRLESTRVFWGVVGVATAIGLVVRVLYTVLFQWSHPPRYLFSDEFHYRVRAALLANGYGFTTHVYPTMVTKRMVQEVVLVVNSARAVLEPLYSHGSAAVAAATYPPLTSILLAGADLIGLVTSNSQMLIMVVIGTLTVWVIGATGRRVAGPGVGVLAAFIAALYPVFWIESSQVEPEPISILLVTVALYFTYRMYQTARPLFAAALGVVCGIAILTRTEALMLIPILIWATALFIPSLARLKRLKLACIGTAVALLVILPWAVFTLTAFNRPEFLSSNGGPTLLDGNCPASYYGPDIGLPGLQCRLSPSQQVGDESNQDYLARSIAFSYFKSHLSRAPLVFAVRFARSWYLYAPNQDVQWEDGPYNMSPSVQYAGIVVFWILLVLGTVGVVALRRRRSYMWPLLGVIILYTAVCTFILPYLRFRSIGDVGLVLLAAAGVDAILARRTNASAKGALEEQDARSRARSD